MRTGHKNDTFKLLYLLVTLECACSFIIRQLKGVGKEPVKTNIPNTNDNASGNEDHIISFIIMSNLIQ